MIMIMIMHTIRTVRVVLKHNANSVNNVHNFWDIFCYSVR